VPTLLAESGLDAESIPLDVLDALKAGRIGALELANWKAVLANPLTKLLAGMAYIRNRLLADPRLPSVLGIELGVGVCAVFAAEKAARRERFFKELDFVIANQVLICLTNIALVLALTPTAAIAAPAAAGSLAAYMASLPGYFLQEGSFSAGQRAACFFSKAAQFSVVGSMTAAAGQGVTKGLVAMRTALNPESPPEVELAPVLETSAAYAMFMAGSSNTRYQLLNSFEGLVLPTLPGGTAAKNVLVAVVRTGNNYLGSANWIWWAKFRGLQ